MHRRKNYFVKKRFQTNFFLKFVALLLMEAMLIAALFMYASHNTITTGYLGSVLTTEKTSDFFFASFLIITLIVAVGIGIAGIVEFMLLSHRIAGPLFRFEKTLTEIEKGDLTLRIDLRRSDQLTELKEALNLLTESLDTRMGRVKEYVKEAQAIILKGGYSAENISKLKYTLDLISDELKHFKITSGSSRE